MNTETKISQADLARHWDVSKSYVSQLASRKGMPPFRNLAEADTWRALNAPPKPALEAVRSSSESGQSRKKTRDSSQPQHPADSTSASASVASPSFEQVDIQPFVDRSGDFDTLMVQDAEAMPKIARGLFDRACRNLNVAEIANFLKIWSEAAGKASDARQNFLNIKERARALIPMDDVEDVLGTELQALRSAMNRLGVRSASRANPADPALAQRVIDAEVDAMWRQLEAGITNAKRELVEGKANAETDAEPDAPQPGAADPLGTANAP